MNALVPAIELYGTGAFSFAEKAGDDGAGAGGSGPADERRQINVKLENYEVHLPSYSIGDRIYDKVRYDTAGNSWESKGLPSLPMQEESILEILFLIL